MSQASTPTPSTIKQSKLGFLTARNKQKLLPLVRKTSPGYFVALANLAMVLEMKMTALYWEAAIVLMI